MHCDICIPEKLAVILKIFSIFNHLYEIFFLYLPVWRWPKPIWVGHFEAFLSPFLFLVFLITALFLTTLNFFDHRRSMSFKKINFKSHSLVKNTKLWLNFFVCLQSSTNRCCTNNWILFIFNWQCTWISGEILGIFTHFGCFFGFDPQWGNFGDSGAEVYSKRERICGPDVQATDQDKRRPNYCACRVRVVLRALKFDCF